MQMIRGYAALKKRRTNYGNKKWIQKKAGMLPFLNGR